jgi:hypothetical protein
VPLGTLPSDVAGSKLQVMTRTTVPMGCSTVSVALVNATSSIDTVQFAFGQSGAPAIVAGADVVLTPNGVVPFLISDFGMTCVPVRVMGAGFCPGAAFPPKFVQVEMTFPVALSETNTSSFPSPERAPDALRNRPPSLNEGLACAPPLRWTLDASATEAVNATASRAAKRIHALFTSYPPVEELLTLKNVVTGALHVVRPRDIHSVTAAIEAAANPRRGSAGEHRLPRRSAKSVFYEQRACTVKT